MSVPTVSDLTKVVKWATACPMSVLMGNQRPIAPSAACGRGWRFFLGWEDRRVVHMGDAVRLLACKRNFPDPGKEFREMALASHRRTMTRDPAPLDEEERAFLRRTVRSVLALGKVAKKRWTIAGTVRPGEGKALLGGKSVVPVEVWKWSRAGGDSRWDAFQPNRDRVSETTDKAWLEGLVREGEAVAKVAVAYDSFKARVMTLHPIAIALVRELQQRVSAALGRLGPFEFTRKDVKQNEVPGVLMQEWRHLGSCALINSADYAAATDAIAGWETRVCVEEIFRVVPAPDDLDPALRWRSTDEGEGESVEEWIVRTICFNTLRYPDGATVQQTNGQLMGHYLSFVCLCLLNFNLYWGTVHGGRELTVKLLHELPVRINGDDLVSVWTRAEQDRFEERAAELGWELSIGKSYVHTHIGGLNSLWWDFARKGEWRFGQVRDKGGCRAKR